MDKEKFEKIIEMMKGCCTDEEGMPNCCSMMKKMIKCRVGEEAGKNKKDNKEKE